MPPVRSMPMVKPIKTERTHEENQERAYIAASRRSDRSLEARVESARRASEIHRRRTGRSLRVTEQDVINEEMYEEEDDDLPMQYRRLTAHLQTSNADFDRRLAAYLTNHVAMRTALGQAVQQTQIFSNPSQFAGQTPSVQPGTPFNAQNMSPPTTRSPAMVRPSPYPLPQHSMKHSMHGRSSSVATPNELQMYPSPFQFNVAALEARRNSVPVSHMPSTPNNAHGQGKKTSPSITDLKFENQTSASFTPSPTLSPPKSQSGSKSSSPKTSHSQAQVKPSELPHAFDTSSNPIHNGFGAVPFSTSLPLESQQLLGGTFDNGDPMTAMLMGPGFLADQQMCNSGHVKSEYGSSTAFNGMDQTLAPGFLDTSVGGFGLDSMPNSAFSDGPQYATSAGGYGSGLDQRLDFSGLTSGEVTPANERDWQNLINGTVWEDASSQTAN